MSERWCVRAVMLLVGRALWVVSVNTHRNIARPDRLTSFFRFGTGPRTQGFRIPRSKRRPVRSPSWRSVGLWIGGRRILPLHDRASI
ncbi:hypothetical protein B0T18DRAFT_194492 [Schizothecium vesticola]|uniref:Secreted protein n=1 Tax=Schizothecium vesticola TaxID=314040 RepID=A0AA40ER79_9PEZI|nr:hypothetical protein B0T18DRAFT_194492 [Schizothecium vesticola]